MTKNLPALLTASDTLAASHAELENAISGLPTESDVCEDAIIYGVNKGGWMLKERANTGMRLAFAEAQKSLREQGIPIGAVLIDHHGTVLGAGHNRRLQRTNPILHAEIDCLARAGRRHDYGDTTLYSTLMPCYMCAGAVVQFGIRRVVVGESRNFAGAAELLRDHGVEVVDLDSSECRETLGAFIREHPHVWAEDIGRNDPSA